MDAEVEIPPYTTLTYGTDDEAFGRDLVAAFRARGVVAVTRVFAPDECDAAVEDIVSDLERLAPGLNRYEPASWTRDNLPPQTRVAMYQAVVGNFAAPWRLRADARVRRIFTLLYSGLRGRPVTDFLVSGDGLSLQPRFRGPFGESEDWAHLDQTSGPPFRCAQGQVVLTDTTACFRASPGSHRVFEELLRLTGGRAAGDWRRFAQEDYPAARALVEGAGGRWQIPVRAPRGSVLLWASSVVHSALRPDGPAIIDPENPWRGWRCVVYVCYRPREEFTRAQRRKRREAYERNRVTNHWATRLFPVNPCARYGLLPSNLRVPEELGFGPQANYVTSPAAVYSLLGRPVLDRAGRRLAGYSTESSSSSGDDFPGPEGEAAEPLTDAELDELLAGL